MASPTVSAHLSDPPNDTQWCGPLNETHRSDHSDDASHDALQSDPPDDPLNDTHRSNFNDDPPDNTRAVTPFAYLITLFWKCISIISYSYFSYMQYICLCVCFGKHVHDMVVHLHILN